MVHHFERNSPTALRRGCRTSTSGALTAPRWRSRKPTLVTNAEPTVRPKPTRSMRFALPRSGALTGEQVGNERAGEPARARLPPRSVLAALLGAVDLDLLLGDRVGHLALLLDGLLVQAHALLRDGALLHDGLLGVERDLVLLLGDRRAVGGLVDVGVGDRLALDADLLALHRHRRLDLVRDDVLAQAGTARLTLRLADRQLLLGARHGVVGLGARDVVADRRPGVERAPAPRAAGGAGAALRQPRAGARLAVVQPVVLVERLLLRLRELPVRVDVGRVLDVALLERHLHAVAGRVGLLQRHEGALAAEQAGLHQRPLGLIGLGVEVDLLDRPDLLPVVVEELLAPPLQHVLGRRHVCLPRRGLLDGGACPTGLPLARRALIVLLEPGAHARSGRLILRQPNGQSGPRRMSLTLPYRVRGEPQTDSRMSSDVMHAAPRN